MKVEVEKRDLKKVQKSSRKKATVPRKYRSIVSKSSATEIAIQSIVKKQREYFQSGATLSYESRIEALGRLKKTLIKYESELHQALMQDLGKPEFEAYLTETGFSLNDITATTNQLKKWMKPKKRKTALLTQPGTSAIYYSPLGVNLIIAPYNYPINLTFSPLVAAIAAGNTAVVKTSELTVACSEIIRKVICEAFDPKLVAHVEGEVEETTILLKQKFDHIFFTGSPRVGSIIMRAAADNLTRVTLELGGKSPCIVHKDAKIDITVNRLVGSKFLNAGQTCVAPDYVLVHKSVKEEFLAKIKRRILKVYGGDPSKSPDFARIVSDNHFERICGLIDKKKILVGGGSDKSTRFIAPTVLRDVTLNDKIMSDEIFGPLLPVLDYEETEEIYDTIRQLPQHPLASYVFSESADFQEEMLRNIQSGGACINNCLYHIANHHIPFGGVGESGMGAYHGFDGFECFSHKKGVLKSASWIDNPLTYPPYGDKLKFVRKLMK